MPISSQGTTFTFPGISAVYTSIQVDEPEPEIVDMTSPSDPLGVRRMMDTGDMKSPGRVTVDYLRERASRAPLRLSGSYGVLTLSHPQEGSLLQVGAIVESATTEVSAGDLVRGRITFMIDHTTPNTPVSRSF